MSDTDQERLVRIETKLDMLLSAEADKETRIRTLERRDAYVLGACVVLSFVAQWIGRELFKL